MERDRSTDELILAVARNFEVTEPNGHHPTDHPHLTSLFDRAKLAVDAGTPDLSRGNATRYPRVTNRRVYPLSDRSVGFRFSEVIAADPDTSTTSSVKIELVQLSQRQTVFELTPEAVTDWEGNEIRPDSVNGYEPRLKMAEALVDFLTQPTTVKP